MTTRFERAEILAAIWRLGAKDKRLPTSHGILDNALKACLDQLPDVLTNGLSFSYTSVGLRCHQVPDILLAGQEALLTTEPNPTYLSSMVTLDDDTAREIALGFGLSTKAAREAGAVLLEAVERIRKEWPDKPEESAAA